MKFLKGTLALFVLTLICTTVSASAQSLGLINVKLPVWKGTYSTKQYAKTNDNLQSIYKQNALDSVSGDGRNVEARVVGVFSGMGESPWTSTASGSTSTFKDSKSIGDWKLNLRSVKSLGTTAGFWGTWYY